MGGNSSKLKEIDNLLHTKTDKDILKLVKKGKDINQKYSNGSTTLHLAAEHGHDNVVKYLLKNGADVTIKDTKGRMPIAYSYGYPTIVQKLTKDIPAITVDELVKYYGYLKRLNEDKFDERRKFNNMEDKNKYATSSDYVVKHFMQIQKNLKDKGYTRDQLIAAIPLSIEVYKSNNYKIKF